MMNKPVVADNKPKKVNLEPNITYYFCTCGRSENQPFCDGSHKGSQFKPKPFSSNSKEAYLCQCKQSSNLPFCDGTHNQIDDTQIGQPLRLEKKSSLPQAKNTVEEPTLELIHQLAKEGLSQVGHHGPMTAMGVPRNKLPHWDELQLLVAQLAKKPLMEDVAVDTQLIVGKNSKKPLVLSIPIIISDMSFGALSFEAKCALSQGAEKAGTGICSGEGGMLPEEQARNSHYFYELASAMFGYDEAHLSKVQAFHFKGGQGAKTGTGGHLPANKIIGKIAEVRKLKPGTPAVSPPTFENLTTVEDFKQFAARVRDISGGIPVGVKLSANHIEQDVAFAIQAGADYIILDGRGGGTGAAPEIFRDHISVPTIPALVRARKILDDSGQADNITLFITGGLRTPIDFVKALALGADGIAIANSAIQAIGCVGARICNTNLCPSGVATQDASLTKQIQVDKASERLYNFLSASVDLMKVMARACGYDALHQFNQNDLTTWNYDMHRLTKVNYAGYGEY